MFSDSYRSHDLRQQRHEICQDDRRPYDLRPGLGGDDGIPRVVRRSSISMDQVLY